MEEACLIILAGGKGTRLGGRDKAWLEIGGRPLLERILTSLGPLFVQRVVVRGAGQEVGAGTAAGLQEGTGGPLSGRQVLRQQGDGRAPGLVGRTGPWSGGEVEFTTDLFPGYGPLAGIHAGLLKSRYFYNLVVACDMPFTDPRLASYLLEQARGYDAVVPRIGGLLEPLFAVYSRNCLGPVQRSLEAGKRRTYDLFNLVQVRYVEEEEINSVTSWAAAFFNINTPEELEKARTMALPRQEG